MPLEIISWRTIASGPVSKFIIKDKKFNTSKNIRPKKRQVYFGGKTYLNTDVYTTEKLNVTNSGSGPALTITQTSQTNNIMNISNYNSEVFNIANNGTITTNNNNINAGSGTITATTFSGNATTATTATTATAATAATTASAATTTATACCYRRIVSGV